jgi:hypothetical protein
VPLSWLNGAIARQIGTASFASQGVMPQSAIAFDRTIVRGSTARAFDNTKVLQ